MVAVTSTLDRVQPTLDPALRANPSGGTPMRKVSTPTCKLVRANYYYYYLNTKVALILKGVSLGTVLILTHTVL